jgi:hypothetical protein
MTAMLRRVVALAVPLIAIVACQGPPAPPRAPATGTAPHGDHKPHHGGLVMMKGDLHYEIVFDPRGRGYQVYFTDAVRRGLPASTASEVTLTIMRSDAAAERIELRIDAGLNAWVGTGRPVAEPDRTNARLAFTIKSEPYWIDLPFTTPSGDGSGG